MTEYSNSVMEIKNVNALRNKLDAKLTDLLNMYNIVKALGHTHLRCTLMRCTNAQAKDLYTETEN